MESNYKLPGNATTSLLISSTSVDIKVDAFLSFAIMVGTARIMTYKMNSRNGCYKNKYKCHTKL